MRSARSAFVFENYNLAATYSPSKEVPSALEGLTAVFGMFNEERSGATILN